MHNDFFRNHIAKLIISNNANELIGRRQKGRVMTKVKFKMAKHETLTGSYHTSLSKWNCIEIVNGAKTNSTHIFISNCAIKNITWCSVSSAMMILFCEKYQHFSPQVVYYKFITIHYRIYRMRTKRNLNSR